jgi:plastocyanin
LEREERGELVRSYLEGAIGRRVFVRRLLGVGISAAAAVSYADLLAPATARAAARRGRSSDPFPLPNGFYNFYVGVIDNAFGGGNVRVLKRGDSVSWGFVGSKDHSATEGSGLAYFDSGYAPPARIMYTMVFPAAGTFPYHCKDPNHSATMKGAVKVPVGRTPASAPLGTQFTIKWAQKPAQPGYVFDVQIKRPGETAFHAFRTGITGAHAAFTPGARGKFFFRGRVRSKATGEASGYSPATSIVVTWPTDGGRTAPRASPEPASAARTRGPSTPPRRPPRPEAGPAGTAPRARRRPTGARCARWS